MRRRIPIIASALALAAGLAGCGGAVGAGGGDASSLAPPDSLAFAAIDTDLGSSQWKAVDSLTSKFPVKAQAIKSIEQSLSKNGVDFNNDVKPALGSQLDVAVLSAGGKMEAVGMTKPSDQGKFDQLLSKLDSSSSSSKKTLHEQVAGWTVFSDQQSAIDAAKQASTGRSLADVASYKDAMATVSQDAVAKVYVNGAAVQKLIPGTSMLAASTTPSLDWLAARLSATSTSVEFTASAKTTGQSAQQPSRPRLLADAPSGALLFASWNGSGQSLQGSLSSPSVAPYLGQFNKLLGVPLQSLLPLLHGQGAFWVAPGTPIPEVALELQEQNDAQAKTTLDQLAHGIAKLTKQKLTSVQTSAGRVPAINVGPLSILFAVANGRAVVTDSTDALKAPASSLSSDPSFTQALKDAGAPTQTLGLLYANLKDLVPFVSDLSGFAGTQLTAQERANLEPLRFLVAYASAGGGISRSTAYLETQ